MENETPTTVMSIRLDALRLAALKRIAAKCRDNSNYTFVAAQFVPSDIILEAMCYFVEDAKDVTMSVTMALCNELKRMMSENPYWPVDPEQLKHYRGLAVCGLFICWAKGSREEKGYGLIPVKHLGETFYKVKLPIVKKAGKGKDYWEHQKQTIMDLGVDPAEADKAIKRLKVDAGETVSVRPRMTQEEFDKYWEEQEAKEAARVKK